MPNHLSAAIANEFIRLNGGPIFQMKLHKLCYMAHGWNLAIYHEPLIADRPEAWDNGPVFRTIWNTIRDWGTKANGILNGPFGSEIPQAQLTDYERPVIQHVWRKYGNKNGTELSRMTHEPGTPWTQTYFGQGRDATIPDDLIEEHFRSLALASRG